MKKKRVLVIGSEGFIGKHLCRALEKKGYRVHHFDKKMGEEWDIFHHKLEYYIRNNDVVVHLAAYISVEASLKNPSEVYRTNVLGTARVVEYCAKYKKKLIFPSSAAVYSANMSPYAETKLITEYVLNGMKSAFPSVVLRLFNVYGPGMNEEAGSIMHNFLTNKKIIIYGDGEQVRDFIHVRDVVGVMIDAIEKKNYNGVVLNVGTGKGVTTNYIAGIFAYVCGKEIEYKNPRRETRYSVADTQTLQALYKKPLTTSLEKDIKELINYYHEN